MGNALDLICLDFSNTFDKRAAWEIIVCVGRSRDWFSNWRSLRKQPRTNTTGSAGRKTLGEGRHNRWNSSEPILVSFLTNRKQASANDTRRQCWPAGDVAQDFCGFFCSKVESFVQLQSSRQQPHCTLTQGTKRCHRLHQERLLRQQKLVCPPLHLFLAKNVCYPGLSSGKFIQTGTGWSVRKALRCWREQQARAVRGNWINLARSVW